MITGDGTAQATAERPGRQFDAFAATYASTRPEYPAALYDRLLTRHGGRFAVACDIGCGTGQSLVGLARVTHRLIGIDPSPAMRALAAQRCPSAEIRDGSGEDSGQADHSCDLVSFATAFHWTDPERALAEAERIIRPGGLLAIYRYDLPEPAGRAGALFRDLLASSWRTHIPEPFRRPADPFDALRSDRAWRDVERDLLPFPITYSVEDFVAMIFATSYVRGYCATLSDPDGYRREIGRAFADAADAAIVAHLDIKITDAVRHE